MTKNTVRIHLDLYAPCNEATIIIINGYNVVTSHTSLASEKASLELTGWFFMKFDYETLPSKMSVRDDLAH